MQRCNFTFRETATGDARAQNNTDTENINFLHFFCKLFFFIFSVSLRFVVLTSISIVMRVQHIYVYNTWQHEQCMHIHVENL